MRMTLRTVFVAALTLPGVAHAQPDRVPDGRAMPPANGVVKPGPTVDPGMKIIKPKAPVASTPVIKPKTTAPDGTVVVPR